MVRRKQRKTRYSKPGRLIKVPRGFILIPNLIFLLGGKNKDVRLSLSEFNDRVKPYFDNQRDLMNKTIQMNAGKLDVPNGMFSSAWARDNVVLPNNEIIIGRQQYWSRVNIQVEAARLLQSYNTVSELYKLTHNENHEPLPNEELQAVLEKIKAEGNYVKSTLIKSVLKKRQAPRVPKVMTPRYCLNMMARQCGQQLLNDKILLLHDLCIGDDKYDVVFKAEPILKRFQNLTKISRPTIQYTDGQVNFLYSIIENVQEETITASSVLAVDRNADHNEVISLARMNANGSVSYPLGPSVQTQATIHHKNRIEVELKRCLKRDKNLDAELDRNKSLSPFKMEVLLDKRIKIKTKIQALRCKLDGLKTAIDSSMVSDVYKHALPGEAIIIEKLKMLNGFSSFRHGSTTEKLEHVAGRLGKRLVQVNPAYTTSGCLCGGSVEFEEAGHVTHCKACGLREDRQDHAAPRIGARGLRALGYDAEDSRFKDEVHSLADVEARSQRKRANRLAKMERRAARGSKTYRVNDSYTRSRPVGRLTPSSFNNHAGPGYRSGSLPTGDWPFTNRVVVSGHGAGGWTSDANHIDNDLLTNYYQVFG